MKTWRVRFYNDHVIFKDRDGYIRVRLADSSILCDGWPVLSWSEAFRHAS